MVVFSTRMADVIKKFNYSKTRGRGRGILGLTNFDPCRRPGERSSSVHHQSVSACQSQCEMQQEPPPQARVENEQRQTEESASAGVYVVIKDKKKNQLGYVCNIETPVGLWTRLLECNNQ